MTGDGELQPEQSTATFEIVEPDNRGGTSPTTITDVHSTSQEEKERIFERVEREMDIFRRGKYSRFQASTHVLNGLGKWSGTPTKKRERRSTLTSPKSTPSLLSRMRDKHPGPRGRRPNLWERLSLSDGLSDSETRSKTSWTRSQGEVSRKKIMSSAQSAEEREKTRCPGTTLPQALLVESAASKPAKHYSSSAKTFQESSHSCELPTTYQKESLHPNGIDYFEVNPSISTKSSPQCILSSLMKRERDAWEVLKSCLPCPNLNDTSKWDPSGHPPSAECQRQLPFFSPTEGKNYSNTPNMSKVFLQPNKPVLIRKSSSMTNQSATRLEGDKISYSPTTTDSTASARPYCMPTESSIEQEERGQQKEETGRTKETPLKRMSAEGSMAKRDAPSQRKNATTSMSARDAEREATGSSPVPQRNTREVTNGMRPKYLRHNIWDPESDFSPNTSDWTLTAEPLEGPPQSALDDEVVKRTIRENPQLFKIVTPICVDVFESYLASHPNPAFVKSVCRGLREGFWPWAATTNPDYPTVNNESRPAPTDLERADFLRKQRDIEVAKDRFSAPFKHELLPGMYCMPIYAVPKPHSTDFRLVTNQSYGKYSLNSMIRHDKVTGYPLDNMVHFGEMLMDLDKKAPGEERVAWKSDVAEAYCILPMHPHWQVKQVNRIDDEYHVDRCNVFGGMRHWRPVHLL